MAEQRNHIISKVIVVTFSVPDKGVFKRSRIFQSLVILRIT